MMMKRSLFVASFSALLSLALVSLAGCFSSSSQKPEVIPAHPISKGVSAPFAGIIGNWMIVGGGCNFPNVPAADGGTKVYYKDIYSCCLNSDTIQWQKAAEFPHPVAYGATIQTDNGLVCIGGMNDEYSMTSVYRLGIDQHTGKVTVETLPSVPETMDNFVAAKVGQILYITGGNQGHGGKSLYALCLGVDTEWKKLADYPGPKRIQPVLLGSDNSLFLMGGFDVDAEKKEAILSSNFLVYNVGERSWSNPEPIPAMEDGSPRALVGSSAVHVGNRLIIAGGVNYSIFKKALEGKVAIDYLMRPADWYAFTKQVLAYNLTTKEWVVSSPVEGFNKAGGCLLYHNNILYMVCGEIKPGIRTPEVVSTSLIDLFTPKNL